MTNRRSRDAALRVVLADDGSAGAELATSLVASLPWADGSSVRVVGVIDEAAARAGERGLDLSAAVEAAASELDRPGLAVEPAIRRGDPATAIATEAETLEADLVVVGSRGVGGIRSLVVGSVATALVDSAPCPVLVARVPHVRGVVVATDGSPHSEAATDAVARWSIFEDVPIRVLSVATAVPQYGDLATAGSMREAVAVARQQKIADAAARRLRDAGVQALPDVRTGDAAAKIVAFARAEGIDLIVLGSRGHTGIRRAVLGSVARAVLSSADTSVLVVRQVDR